MYLIFYNILSMWILKTKQNNNFFDGLLNTVIYYKKIVFKLV